VLLSLDVQHFALQRQSKGDVRHFVESQPRNGVLQGSDGPFGPLRRRCRDAQHVHGERGIRVDDIRELPGVGRALGAYDTNGYFRQYRHGEFISGQNLLQKSVDDFPIIHSVRGIDRSVRRNG